jgi:hypothetical protein
MQLQHFNVVAAVDKDDSIGCVSSEAAVLAIQQPVQLEHTYSKNAMLTCSKVPLTNACYCFHHCIMFIQILQTADQWVAEDVSAKKAAAASSSSSKTTKAKGPYGAYGGGAYDDYDDYAGFMYGGRRGAALDISAITAEIRATYATLR